MQPLLTPLQHPDMARFNPRTINTLRLVTFEQDFAGAIAVVAAVRISSTSLAVDNWSAGGVMVPADIGEGVLGEFGIVKNGLAVVDAHPQSGLAFKGFSIPHFREAAGMACRVHDKLDVASLGWDIALLEDGPRAFWKPTACGIFISRPSSILGSFLSFSITIWNAGARGCGSRSQGPFANRDIVRDVAE